VRDNGGEQGETAAEMLTLWENMLGGNWKVGKDREKRAKATASKYTVPASVLNKITHGGNGQVGYPQQIKEPKARGQAKLDAAGFAVLYAKAQFGVMEQQLSAYRRKAADTAAGEFPKKSAATGGDAVDALSASLPAELASRPNGAGEAWYVSSLPSACLVCLLLPSSTRYRYS